jgi:hypothetical protein
MSELQMRIYFILAAPFLIPAAVVLGLWLAPFGAFAYLAGKPAINWEGGFAVNGFSWLLAIVFVLSLCWPFAVLYGIAQL